MPPKIKHKVEEVPLDLLLPHPMNPRRGDVDKIAESILKNGFYGTIVAQKSTRYILAGNHRWRAATKVGLESVPVMWLDISDAQAKKILLADNKTSDDAHYDPNELQALLRSVLAESDLRGTGYQATDIDQLIDDAIDEPNEKRVRNLEPFNFTYWIVKAPVTAQGKVSEVLDLELADIEGVEIASANN